MGDMSLAIYKKAFKLVKTGNVKITDITEKFIWAKVKGYSVKISLTDNIFSCECMWGSLNLEKIGQKNFCSHVLAVAFELMENNEKYSEPKKIP